ncbi:hypothetical protein [Rubritalea tangerina]|uniref:hypothetical protein n=1 Tax=Rubritalea tangerina TaxID=430798 RepID=UPI00361D2C87
MHISEVYLTNQSGTFAEPLLHSLTSLLLRIIDNDKSLFIPPRMRHAPPLNTSLRIPFSHHFDLILEPF